MTVLVPIDESECSFRALRFAADFVDRFETELHVIHIVDHYTEATEELLERAMQVLKEEGVQDSPEVLTEMKKFRAADRVGDRIVSIYHEDDYDHVIMGHHGAGAAEKLLLGSASETVIEANEVPVTVVP